MVHAESDEQVVESFEELHTRPAETNSSLQAAKDDHLNSESRNAYDIDSNRNRKIKLKRPETV